MTVLLITGAGSSRNLGAGQTLMPLMADWSDALCTALEEKEAGLATACHLIPGMDGPKFEKNLGLLLKWQQVRHLEERFGGLSGQSVGTENGQMGKARKLVAQRMSLVVEALNSTLYEQFGQSRIDDDRAASAYKALMDHLGRDIIFATTNYDRAGETALANLGFNIDTGFRSKPHRTPTLEPAELVSNRGSKTPVLHLHGAVGWYEKDGSVVEHHADQPYNPSLGTPVVLYPDPDKDPTNDAIVSQLWTEFQRAADIADAVVVVGHSLHDPALVRVLSSLNGSKPILVSYFSADDSKRIESLLPDAGQFELDFEPNRKIKSSILQTLPNLTERQPA